LKRETAFVFGGCSPFHGRVDAEGGKADVAVRAFVGIEFIPVVVPVKIGFDIGMGF